MQYKILAHKWRPRTFNEIVGQKHILTIIQNSFRLKKIHHAYLLSGTRGVGKTTIARLFVKSLNCLEGITFNPCGVCQICLDIDKGCFFDCIEIDAASRTGVEDTREFLDNIYYAPTIGRFKVYLIDEVHMLSRHSFNALLKILEEPPKHVKFLLITTEPKKVPLTILSRCVQLCLRPLTSIQIFNRLIHIFNQENIKIEFNSIQLLAHYSNGSMRDALSLSEQAIVLGNNTITDSVIREMLGIIDTEHALFLIEALIDNDANKIMSKITECDTLDVNWDYLLSDVLYFLQKIAIFHFSKENCFFHEKKSFIHRLIKLSNRISLIDVQLYYQIVLIGRKELLYAPSYRMGVEMIMLRALFIHPSNNFIHKCNITNKFEESDNTRMNFVNMIINQGMFIHTFSDIQNISEDFLLNKKDIIS